MHRVLIVFPTSWDRKQLTACRESWKNHFEITYSEPDDESCPSDFDIFRFIDQHTCLHGSLTDESGNAAPIDGVFSSSDYPGATVAGALSQRLGLPGTPPQRIIGCSHKYYSRVSQRESVPEATPWFELIDPTKLSECAERCRFPCFIKPVKGAFSIMSKRVQMADELIAFMSSEDALEFLRDYVDIFDRLVHGLTDYEVGGRFFIAEELLQGFQVTVEGFAVDGNVEILGVVDSVMHAHAPSFARFVYPSSLEDSVQERMINISRRAIEHIGLNYSFFNIELIYDSKANRISIIEINPRLCGQFADLYQKVDGHCTYELALHLVVGQRPKIQRNRGRWSVAASVPLRVFEPCVVVQSPEESRVVEVQQRFEDTLLWTECRTGDRLANFEDEDGSSYRYGVINLGADNLDDLDTRLQAIESNLQFNFEKL